MALEASIVERLQELRRWQVKQQERLLQQQQEQRESLSREQVRMYQALGLSIHNISCTDENKSDSVYKDSLEESRVDTATVETKHENPLMPGIENAESPRHLSPQIRHKLLHDSSHSLLRDEQDVINDRNSPRDGSLSSAAQFVVSKKQVSSISEANQPSENIENEFLDQSVDDLRENILVSNAELSMDGVEPLPLDKPTKKLLIIDDIPVPSPNKDFHTLLEERLRESQSGNDASAGVANCTKPVKRSFLKKGQGLARFRLNSGSENSTRQMRPRTMSLPSTVRMEGSKNVKSNSDGANKAAKTVKRGTCKIEKAVKKPVPISNRAQSKLSLKNVQPPARVRSKSMCNPRESAVPSNIQLKDDDKFSISDIESKTKREMEEVRIFELLEEKAENSSFCSTSSTVVALLQQSVQSTPLKMKSLNKNKVPSLAQNWKNREDNINEDLLLAEIVSTTQSNNAMQKPPMDIQVNKDPEENEMINLKDNQFFYNDDDEGNSTDNICDLPYGTDVDPDYGTNYSVIDGANCVSEKDFNRQVNYAKSTSLHVRFSEYNEYKTIGLTDTSTISTESGPPRNYSDHRAWSDCSVTTDSSDAEESTSTIENVRSKGLENNGSFTSQSKLNDGEIYDNRHFDNKFLAVNVGQHRGEHCAENQSKFGINGDKKYYENLNYEEVEGDDDSVTTLEEIEKNESSSGENEGSPLADSTLIEEELDSGKTQEDGLIFKSELLKIRLLELEKEIEIFRKENIALTTLKEKLQEERKTLERNFKEKESRFEERKQKLESAMQEEKKRLTREKAALENRLKDAQVKAQQSKQERQEVQSLRDQLEELREEMNQKESRWNAAQARHRSQVRILQSESSKLKQEIQKLQNAGKATARRKLQVKQIPSSNTKAIHQINKQLDSRKQQMHGQDFSSDEDEFLMQPMMEAMRMNEFTDDQKDSNKINSDGSKMIVYGKSRTELNRNCSARKRDLYENLLKDATIGLKESEEATKKAVQNLEKKKNFAKRDDQSIDLVEDMRDFTDTDHNSGGICNDSGKNFSSCENEVVAEKMLDTGSKNTVDAFDNYTRQERSTNNYISLHESAHKTETTDISGNKKEINCKTNGTVNKQGIREVNYPDGRTEFWYPNGNVKKISADGAITKLIYYNGDVCESRKDGSVKYFYAATRTWHTTMPDGLEILEFPEYVDSFHPFLKQLIKFYKYLQTLLRMENFIL